MYGPAKDALWAAVRPTLKGAAVTLAFALLRAGGPDVEPERVDL